MVAKGYMLIPSALRRSSSFQQDFKQLVTLSKDAIEKLALLGESEDGYMIPDESISNMSTDLGIEEKKFIAILNVIRFLYNSVFQQEIDADDAASEVCALAEELGVTDCADKYSAIQHLFERKESYDYRILAGSAESAIVPIIARAGIECDVRAITDPKTDEILGYVPIALVNIEIEKQDGERESITFQIKEEHIDELSKYLERAKKLLAKLKEKFGGNNPVK